MNFFIDVFSPYYSNFFLFTTLPLPPLSLPLRIPISHTLSRFIYLHSLYYLLYYLRTQCVRAILVALDDALAGSLAHSLRLAKSEKCVDERVFVRLCVWRS